MTKDIFTKYLQGNCTEEEFEQFLVWIREDPLSTSGKDIAKEIWEELEPKAGPVEKLKYDRLLDKIHHRINISQKINPAIIQTNTFKSRILTVFTRAAAILLIPVLSFLIYTRLSDKHQYAANLNDLEIVAPAGSMVKIDLGDGTKVWLNHGSKLKYPARFEGKARSVFLTGEAFFEVAHNSKIPFIVGTDHLDVKAVGTAFNVSAYPGDDDVETALVEGKVILYNSKSHREISALSPNECLKYSAEKNSYTLDSANTEKYIAWKDGRLVFKNDPVKDIAKRLARWYNVDVEITSDQVSGFTYTATFIDETLPQVLDLLSLATPVNYKLTQRKKLSDGSFSKQKVLIGLKGHSK